MNGKGRKKVYLVPGIGRLILPTGPWGKGGVRLKKQGFLGFVFEGERQGEGKFTPLSDFQKDDGNKRGV